MHNRGYNDAKPLEKMKYNEKFLLEKQPKTLQINNDSLKMMITINDEDNKNAKLANT